MSDQEARKLYYDDSFRRWFFSDNYLHGSADYISHAEAFNLSSTYNSNHTATKDDSLVMISSSTDAAGNEEEEANISKKYKQSKLEGEDGGGSAKKINNLKKDKAPRFAFMTKSETDLLEDGYRWRKYGQKALKSSPYPRGYYRCTTQNCGVKKRVERSFEDPSTVITTYEGSHNHHLPGTLRANVAVEGSSFHNPLNYPAHNYEETGGTTRSNQGRI